MYVLSKKYYRVFVYIVAVIALFYSLYFLGASFNLFIGGGITIRRIVDSMLLALPVLLVKRKFLIFSYILTVNLYLLSIIWYFRTYDTIMPLSSYLMIDNLEGLGSSILHSIHTRDLLQITPSLLFLLFYIFIYKKDHCAVELAQVRLCALVVSLLIIIGMVGYLYLPNKRPYYKQPFYCFQTENVIAFQRYGVIHFWIYQIASLQSVTEDSKLYASAFVNKCASSCNFALQQDTTVAVRKNLILILVEAFQSWPIELKVGDVEVMPNLNQLLKQTNVVYFPNVMPQVKHGRSSDAQLLINTGLLPLETGAAASLCAKNKFLSLPDALSEQGYGSASFICESRTFWNQGATTKAYGFDELYDCMQGDVDRKDADKNLFVQSLPILKNMCQPFYAQLVTLSSHEPYDEPVDCDSELLHKPFYNDEICNYLVAIQSVDRNLAKFIEGLKKEDLYDNSVIVITGDHDQMTYNNYEGRECCKAEDCFVPFIVINSTLTSKHVEKVIGQMDIYPSLLNLMGCNDYIWKGLGESVFGDSISNFVSSVGYLAGDMNSLDSVKNHRHECWKVSDILLRMDYFK